MKTFRLAIVAVHSVIYYYKTIISLRNNETITQHLLYLVFDLAAGVATMINWLQLFFLVNLNHI